ncbi:M14 family metallopeptidase [Maribellus sediminis]|uniref:M14 family metallopeptidase n=1 Tax=Maribellus sediminis TaxID=2696285 RepID=UPI001430326D|nr:M14 family metallopeptidase [Maribellus sediminis]
MRKITASLIVLLLFFVSSAQEKMDYFLPGDVSYNPEIPTPEAFFNQQMGEWHLTHDQVLNYIKTINELSDRAIMYEYARTYENRPLVHLVFTSVENQQNLDELKKKHYDYSEPGSELAKDGVPLVVSLTYGVHGNESSGTNSSVLTAYYLAAAEGEKIDKLLANTIIIVDPCLNPDGFTRHSTWANMHQSAAANGNPDSRQFDEVWPGGRTNHYWFDLNRDYLLLVHPESKGRVEKFHEWKPNIVTDHHEMGANSSFFFQPGVPSRNNPLTPEKNYELTHEIAKYHAQFLDKIGSFYFSEESFDDYYFGKGSSYPDINGSVGILFEQAGFRGRIRQTENGVRKLAFGIKNQFTTSLSTLEAAMNLHDDLLDMQKEFYATAADVADASTVKAYVFGSETDKVKTQLFIDLLRRHQIEVYKNEKDLTCDGKEFRSESSYIVPVKQKQARLILSLFEEVTSFSDTTFYDVSTWTMPLAFDLNYAKLTNAKQMAQGDAVEAEKIEGQVIGGKSSLAYVFRWNEYSCPTALYSLQAAGLRTRVATEKFSFNIDNKNEAFTYGSILVPVSDQKLSEADIFKLITSVAKNTGVDFYGLSTGLSPEGIDAGSNNFALLTRPEVLLFVGGDVRSSDAGEIWHLFDQRFHIPVTLVESGILSRTNLNRYTTIILAGNFRSWDNTEEQKLKTWAEQGGTLIGYKSGAQWAAKSGFGKNTYKKQVDPDTTKYQSYAERGKERTLNLVSGAIFNAQMDITHPLCYGYTDGEISIFKSDNSVANSLEKKFAEPVKYTASPYKSGWASEPNIERIKDAPVVSVESLGRGKLISYEDNMNFRGIWLGTSKLFTNAVFFGNLIE